MSRRPPRYLFVCTANINRSPMAAVWAEHFLVSCFVSAEIRSAGTHAWTGSPAGADTILAMDEHGQDLREHRSQPVTDDLVDWADHVVVMEPMHARRLPDLAASKVVRLWEFLGEPAEEVFDPQGHELDAFRRAAKAIEGAVERMVTRHLAERRGGSGTS